MLACMKECMFECASPPSKRNLFFPGTVFYLSSAADCVSWREYSERGKLTLPSTWPSQTNNHLRTVNNNRPNTRYLFCFLTFLPSLFCLSSQAFSILLSFPIGFLIYLLKPYTLTCRLVCVLSQSLKKASLNINKRRGVLPWETSSDGAQTQIIYKENTEIVTESIAQISLLTMTLETQTICLWMNKNKEPINYFFSKQVSECKTAEYSKSCQTAQSVISLSFDLFPHLAGYSSQPSYLD